MDAGCVNADLLDFVGVSAAFSRAFAQTAKTKPWPQICADERRSRKASRM
jgi:hypothetical protein